MEQPTALAAGVVLAVFGSALLLWCAVELRLRHRLRRHGVRVTARVVADGTPGADPYLEPYGDASGELDSAPLLAYPVAGRADAGVLRAVPDPADRSGAGHVLGGRAGDDRIGTGTGTGTVLARPRGHTPLRRPARLVPGTDVQVAYDARRPGRVVLAGHDSASASALLSDLFWALLGTSTLAGGLSLLGAAFTR
ncbi:hypothetical protein [Kitasatospora sp. MBT63]|uniref:hypothetical protein n=1 Tax=Kitasatospora sp. MBT63 TaxID=1444768 RepID=UPI000539FD49|nr:hypothetical protein [Kitasatospora sp. MBT63]